MNNFKVIEVLDSNRIRVTPKWEVTKVGNEKITGDIVILNSLLNIPNTEYLKQRLTTLLNQKEVDLFNPNLSGPPEIISGEVKCAVYLGNTEISYYFPEYIHHADIS